MTSPIAEPGDFYESVLKAYDGKRIAVDAGYRTYTGRLQWNGGACVIRQDDRQDAWIRTSSITAIRIFPAGDSAGPHVQP